MYPSKLEIDRNISKLRLNAKEFATISNEEMAVLFQKVIDNIKTTSYYWISIASENKGYTKKQSQGEDWVSGPFSTIFAIEYYIKYLNGESELNERNFNTSDNSYHVFPNNFIEKLTFPFVNAKVLFNKNLDFNTISTYRGFANRYKSKTPKITLVLGAGNVSSIPYWTLFFIC